MGVQVSPTVAPVTVDSHNDSHNVSTTTVNNYDSNAKEVESGLMNVINKQGDLMKSMTKMMTSLMASFMGMMSSSGCNPLSSLGGSSGSGTSVHC